MSMTPTSRRPKSAMQLGRPTFVPNSIGAYASKKKSNFHAELLQAAAPSHIISGQFKDLRRLSSAISRKEYSKEYVENHQSHMVETSPKKLERNSSVFEIVTPSTTHKKEHASSALISHLVSDSASSFQGSGLNRSLSRKSFSAHHSSRKNKRSPLDVISQSRATSATRSTMTSSTSGKKSSDWSTTICGSPNTMLGSPGVHTLQGSPATSSIIPTPIEPSSKPDYLLKAPAGTSELLQERDDFILRPFSGKRELIKSVTPLTFGDMPTYETDDGKQADQPFLAEAENDHLTCQWGSRMEGTQIQFSGGRTSNGKSSSSNCYDDDHDANVYDPMARWNGTNRDPMEPNRRVEIRNSMRRVNTYLSPNNPYSRKRPYTSTGVRNRRNRLGHVVDIQYDIIDARVPTTRQENRKPTKDWSRFMEEESTDYSDQNHSKFLPVKDAAAKNAEGWFKGEMPTVNDSYQEKTLLNWMVATIKDRETKATAEREIREKAEQDEMERRRDALRAEWKKRDAEERSMKNGSNTESRNDASQFHTDSTSASTGHGESTVTDPSFAVGHGDSTETGANVDEEQSYEDGRISDEEEDDERSKSRSAASITLEGSTPLTRSMTNALIRPRTAPSIGSSSNLMGSPIMGSPSTGKTEQFGLRTPRNSLAFGESVRQELNSQEFNFSAVKKGLNNVVNEFTNVLKTNMDDLTKNYEELDKNFIKDVCKRRPSLELEDFLVNLKGAEYETAGHRRKRLFDDKERAKERLLQDHKRRSLEKVKLVAGGYGKNDPRGQSFCDIRLTIEDLAGTVIDDPRIRKMWIKDQKPRKGNFLDYKSYMPGLNSMAGNGSRDSRGPFGPSEGPFGDTNPQDLLKAERRASQKRGSQKIDRMSVFSAVDEPANQAQRKNIAITAINPWAWRL